MYYVYILASYKNGTLYIGLTRHLSKRVWEHKNKVLKSFTEQYNVNKLVYYEVHTEVETAIQREKILKKWNRQWKINLIKKNNPDWLDLYNEGHF